MIFLLTDLYFVPLIEYLRAGKGKTVEVAGRLMSFRGHGNVVFADLKDETGQIQLWFQKNNLGDKMKLLKFFDIGDFVLASGDAMAIPSVVL